jgi:hypothetical protein
MRAKPLRSGSSREHKPDPSGVPTEGSESKQQWGRIMKDAKGHGSEKRDGSYGLSAQERSKADYASTVMQTIRSAFTGTALHQVGVDTATAGKSLPRKTQAFGGSAMDRAVAEIEREFSGKPGGRGSSFGSGTPREGSPNPGSNIRAVRRK